MAGQAANAIDADAAGVEHGRVEGCEAEDALLVLAERRMAAGALVLDRLLQPRVHQHLVLHLGAEEGIARAVAHHGAAPVVGHVHVHAVVVHHGDARWVVAVAAAATSCRAEERTEEHVEGIGAAAHPQQGQLQLRVGSAYRRGRTAPRGEQQHQPTEGGHDNDAGTTWRVHGGPQVRPPETHKGRPKVGDPCGLTTCSRYCVRSFVTSFFSNTYTNSPSLVSVLIAPLRALNCL